MRNSSKEVLTVYEHYLKDLRNLRDKVGGSCPMGLWLGTVDEKIMNVENHIASLKEFEADKRTDPEAE